MTDTDDEDSFAEDEAIRTLALHKSAPEVIWLQVDPEAEQFDGWEAQTWCSDKINASDAKYVRADLCRQICRDAYEVWAGSEGIPEPETAAEAYLLQLLIDMRDEVKRGLK